MKWIVAWIVLAALWFLYEGEWNAIELYAAASAATLSLVVAVVVRRQERAGLRLELRWVLKTAVVPWQVVHEFAVITLFLVRPRRSAGIRRLPFPTGGSRPADRGRRTLAALAMTYSPNSYVVHMDEDTHEVVVHTLSPVPPGEELL